MYTQQQASLQDVLDFRERRAAIQAELRARYAATVVSITSNMPGSVKYSEATVYLVYAAVDMMRRRLCQAGFSLLEERVCHCPAGPAAMLAVLGDANCIKAAAVAIEEEQRYGRLLDIDVFNPAGEQISRANIGLTTRRCLVCSENAIVCMRDSRHKPEEVATAVQTLVVKYQADRVALPAEVELIGSIALEAMLLEAACAPAPGLVDRFNSGAHQDMDIFSFLKSSSALAPALYQCALAAWKHSAAPSGLLPVLREIGMKAEVSMFRATGGVNTQKGLLFLMGIVVAATILACKSCKKEVSAERILQTAAEICYGIVAQELGELSERRPDRQLTAGERFYLSAGITGIRGEIEAGLPAVAESGLPNLREAFGQGLSLNDALVHTLLCLMTVTQDTTILKRHGLTVLKAVQQDALDIVHLGGMYNEQGKMRVEDLDKVYIKRGISPGGSADLLAVTYFLYAIETKLKQSR